MGAVLVHIDLDGDRACASSLAALAAGRAVASSWGATLYAALIIHDTNAKPTTGEEPTGQASMRSVPGLEDVQTVLGLAGADKIIVAMSDAPVLPMWWATGHAWQNILDHLRPRLVLFGAESPSAAELGPRTGARLGARLLSRARAVGVEEVELRDRDGGYVRVSDGGAAVVLVGGAAPAMTSDEDVDLVVLVSSGGADPRVELAGTVPAEVSHTINAIIAIGDDVANDAAVAKEAARLGKLLDAPVVGSANAARANAIGQGAVIEKNAPLAPEVCIVIGNPTIDLAGTTSVVRIGGGGGKAIDGSLSGPIPQNVTALRRALEEPES